VRGPAGPVRYLRAIPPHILLRIIPVWALPPVDTVIKSLSLPSLPPCSSCAARCVAALSRFRGLFSISTTNPRSRAGVSSSISHFLAPATRGLCAPGILASARTVQLLVSSLPRVAGSPAAHPSPSLPLVEGFTHLPRSRGLACRFHASASFASAGCFLGMQNAHDSSNRWPSRWLPPEDSLEDLLRRVAAIQAAQRLAPPCVAADTRSGNSASMGGATAPPARPSCGGGMGIRTCPLCTATLSGYMYDGDDRARLCALHSSILTHRAPPHGPEGLPSMVSRLVDLLFVREIGAPLLAGWVGTVAPPPHTTFDRGVARGSGARLAPAVYTPAPVASPASAPRPTPDATPAATP
jgi:hypothetical protein